MSLGNLNTEGQKNKNNYPYQKSVLQLLGAIENNTSLSSIDYEARSTTYEAIANNPPDYALGDIIVRYDIINMATGTIALTLWFNQTDQTTIPAPNPADITPIAGSSSVTVINPGGAFAVNIQDGGNSITIDSSFLDVALSTRGTEATQLLIRALLTTIDADTSNLDVALSTRATEATLAALNAKLNSLGQKASASSAPVVLSTEQEVILDGIAADLALIYTNLQLNTVATQNMLTSLATEATLLDVETAIDTVRLDTANLDVALSTRASEATLATRASEATLATRATEATLATMLTLAGFQARINTLGQKAMAASTPVVLASDQSAIPVTLPAGSDIPSVVNAIVNGSTTAGVKSVSLWFRGANGSAGGVGIPNNGIITFTAEPGKTLSALAYVVPTTLQARIILTYTT